MNIHMIDAWNSVVKRGDKVFVLGDFGFGGSDFISDTLGKLRGNKILIMGNHDRSRSNRKWIELGFHAVYDCPIIYDSCYILSHAPVENLTGCDHFYNIFGHVHGNPVIDTVSGKGFCVSVERHQYKPVLWRDIKDALKPTNVDKEEYMKMKLEKLHGFFKSSTTNMEKVKDEKSRGYII